MCVCPRVIKYCVYLHVRVSVPVVMSPPTGKLVVLIFLMPVYVCYRLGFEDITCLESIPRFLLLKSLRVCVCVCVCVCMYIRTYVRTYVCIMYVCAYVCMYLRMYVYVWYVCMYVRTYVCMYVCLCMVCMYVRMYVCMYVCMCVCMYV